jgi:DNA-3-methyladenine glycosylase
VPILSREFYARHTLDVAHDMIGKRLVHVSRGRRASGIIVEVEAYIGEDDPACHAAPGPTQRNAPLYGPPGFAYVYLNYGMHYLVNAVTELEGRPAAVLIRALEPDEGIGLMRRRREAAQVAPPGRTPDDALCRGPGNLTRALGIDLRQNRLDLTGSTLFVEDVGATYGPIAWSPRVGIRVGVERPWRAFVSGHPSVSGRRVATRHKEPGSAHASACATPPQCDTEKCP